MSGKGSGGAEPSHFDELAETWDTAYRIGRAKTIAEEIRNRLAIGPEDSLLEFGSGTGLVGFNLLAGVGALTFIDDSAGMRNVLAEKIALHPEGGKCKVGDSLFSAELRLGSLDGIYASMVLHHVKDLEGTALRFRELLKVGGSLCIVDLTSDDGAYHSHERGFDGHNGFDPESLSALFGGFGFRERYRDVFYSDARMIAGSRVDYSLFILVMETK